MWEIFIAALPLALAAAISVSALLVFFAILAAKEKQLENGLAFIVGGLISYAIIASLVMFSFGQAAPAGAPQHILLHAGADFVLAGLCVLLAIRAALKKDRGEKKKETRIPGGVLAYLGIGALMRAGSANTLPPFIAAIKDVSGAHLSVESSVILCALIILTSMSPMIFPWLLFLGNREKAVALINPVSRFLEKNKARISNAVLIVIAIYLAAKGFQRLGVL